MYAVWLYFACMTLLLLVAATPAFRLADAPPSDGHQRLRSLDGLRGFLALAVVFHHGAIYHRHLVDGVWELPPSHFYTILGPIGVSLFFMVTGFLFWSRLLRQHGQPGWRRLYVDRVFRIGPLYLVAVAGLLVGVILESGLLLRASYGGLAHDIAPWLTLGLLDGPDIAGYPGTRHLLAGVMWTLQCEWGFYFSLPVLLLLARRGWHHLPVIALLLAMSLLRLTLHPLSVNRLCLLPMFLTGMMCASLHWDGLMRRLPDLWSSAAVLVLLAAVVTTQDGNTASARRWSASCSTSSSPAAQSSCCSSRALRRASAISVTVSMSHRAGAGAGDATRAAARHRGKFGDRPPGVSAAQRAGAHRRRGDRACRGRTAGDRAGQAAYRQSVETKRTARHITACGLAVDRCREFGVARRQAAGIVRRQADVDTVIDVRPFGMVIGFLR